MSYKTVELALHHIRIDGGTQPRTELNEETVAEYAEAMAKGDPFPPVDIYYDGSNNWLADGFHRWHAAKQAGKTLLCNQYQGSRRDAILHSVGANSKHGLRRSNADKRRSVLTLLNDSEWVQMSDVWIAEQCGVSSMFVGKVRKELTLNGLKSAERLGRDGRVINTTNIGTNKPVKPTVEHVQYDGHEDGDIFDSYDPNPPIRGAHDVEFDVTEEVINPDAPEIETPTEPQRFSTQPEVITTRVQEEADMTDDEWLGTLPLLDKLAYEGFDTAQFETAALTWRASERAILTIKGNITKHMPPHHDNIFAKKIKQIGSIRHPKYWAFSREAEGGFIL